MKRSRFTEQQIAYAFQRQALGTPVDEICRKMGITPARVKLWAFWIFAAAGFLLTLSAVLPMLPLLRTPGQKFMFEFHRYSALASLLAAMVFAGLELFETPLR